MSDQNISEEYLNSFVDDQLDPAEKIQVFDAISRSETLKKRVCELRNMKEMVQQAYKYTPAHMQTPALSTRALSKYYQALAACLLLFAGGLSGWFFHSWSNIGINLDTSSTLQSVQGIDASMETRKIIVHLSGSDPIRLKSVLDETEGLLDTNKKGNRQIQIELIANQRGVDLLRADVTQFKKRIDLMHSKYPNLNFMVCGQTLGKLQKNGESVRLLPYTEIAHSAAEQINRRLHQGWSYIRI